MQANLLLIYMHKIYTIKQKSSSQMCRCVTHVLD